MANAQALDAHIPDNIDVLMLPRRGVIGWPAAAQILGRPVASIRSACSRGELDLYRQRLGQLVLFDLDELLELRATREQHLSNKAFA